MRDYSIVVNTNTTTGNPTWNLLDETVAGANDGTPILASMVMEFHAFMLNLSAQQSDPPSGVIDVTVTQAAGDQDMLKWMEEFIRPTGTIFNLFPDSVGDLSTLYPFSVFNNISSLNAGGFWRQVGGLADPFLTVGQQAESTQNIVGTIRLRTEREAPAPPPNGVFDQSTPISLPEPTTVVSGLGIDLKFDASDSNSAYGRRPEIVPLNRTFEQFIKTGGTL